MIETVRIKGTARKKSASLILKIKSRLSEKTLIQLWPLIRSRGSAAGRYTLF